MTGVRQFDEEAVLTRVALEFWQHGYGPTTMQRLAAASGVQRGSLYNAYGGKEELFLAAYEQYRRRYLARFAAALEPDDLETAIASLLDFSVSYVLQDRRGCLTTKAVMDETATEPRIRRVLAEQLEEMVRIVAARCEREPDRLRMTPEQAGRLIVTFTRGIVVMERALADEAALRASSQDLVALLFPDGAAVRAS